MLVTSVKAQTARPMVTLTGLFDGGSARVPRGPEAL